jgi:hypothetical protein
LEASKERQAQQQAGPTSASNKILPRKYNPQNFPIPFESQWRLIAIGVPSERVGSWKEVINWLQHALKRGSVTEWQYDEVKKVYDQLAEAMNTGSQIQA